VGIYGSEIFGIAGLEKFGSSFLTQCADIQMKEILHD
jgi:hypothetical protein